MPHLGVFASVHPSAAQEVFEHDCLIHLGAAVVPVYSASCKIGLPVARVIVDGTERGTIAAGSVARFTSPTEGSGVLRVEPLHRSVNVGAGEGVAVERTIRFGECGIIGDGRNRPFHGASFSVEAQASTYRSVGMVE